MAKIRLRACDFLRDTASVQVKVGGYKLKYELPDTPADKQVPIAAGQPGTKAFAAPSNWAAYDSGCKSKTDNTVTRHVVIKCVDTSDNPVDGCKYRLAIKEGPKNGGHNSAAHAQPRPMVTPNPDAALNQLTLVSKAGENVAMDMPDVSGDVSVEITGTDPGGNPISADPLMFEVKIPALTSLAGISGLTFFVKSHNGTTQEGFPVASYAKAALQGAMQSVIGDFKDLVQKKTSKPANPITSTSASLVWGGIFDIDRDWNAPHCGHRIGEALDVDWKLLTITEQKALAKLVNDSKTVRFYKPESPGSGANHWHIMLK